jgi:hypothetical protein
MSNISVEVCIKALNNAAMSRRAAFQTELAVGFAIFLVNNGTERAARQILVDAYASAGYQCLQTSDQDYKTINRRVNATADLFNRIGVKAVRKWAGKHNDDQLIAAMVEGLRPYELWTVSDVQRYAAPAPVPATPAPTAAPVNPHNGILTGPAAGNNSGQVAVMGLFRRAADQVAKGAEHIETEHMAVMIPKDATPDEIVTLAYKLLEMATKRRESVDTKAEHTPA